jgi:hypothetical protein
MTEWKRSPKGLRILLSLGASAMALFAAGESAMAQMSEIDRYDRAVNSESSVEAVVFIRVFPASHLVDDLIASLPPDVALQVCADLDGGGPRLAQTACKQLQDPLAVAPASGVAAPVASTPGVRSGSTGSGEKCARSPCTVVLLAPAGSVTQPADDAALADTSDTGDTGTGDSVGGTDAASGPGAGTDSGGAVAGSSTDGSVDGSTSGSVGGSTGGSVSGNASATPVAASVTLPVVAPAVMQAAASVEMSVVPLVAALVPASVGALVRTAGAASTRMRMGALALA